MTERSQEIIVLIAVAAAVAWLIWRWWRNRKNPCAGCGCFPAGRDSDHKPQLPKRYPGVR